MAFLLFRKLFPKVAENETRVITFPERHGNLPAGQYAFVESFCDEVGCDCRRAFISVVSDHRDGILATIGYGWESPEFYQRWHGRPDPIAAEMAGISLPPFTKQSNLSPDLLDLFRWTIDVDPDYAKRIHRHYAMFRQAVDEGPELDLSASSQGGFVPQGEEEMDPRLDTPEGCLEELKERGVRAERKWFDQRSPSVTSALALLIEKAPHVKDLARSLALPAFHALWEHWCPDEPCLETRFAQSFDLLRTAYASQDRDETRALQERWVSEVVEMLFDGEGHIREVAAEAVLDVYGQDALFETLLCHAIPLLVPPASPRIQTLLSRLDGGEYPGAGRLGLVRAMALVQEGDIKRGLSLFDHLRRRAPESMCVPLAAGLAVLSVAGASSKLLRQAEWYLDGAHKRLGWVDIRSWRPLCLFEGFEALYTRTRQPKKVDAARLMLEQWRVPAGAAGTEAP